MGTILIKKNLENEKVSKMIEKTMLELGSHEMLLIHWSLVSVTLDLDQSTLMQRYRC